MKKKTRTWLMTATALVCAGCLLFGGVMMTLHWDFSKLSTVKYVTNEHLITEAYHSITVNSNTADIAFMPSSDSTTKVVCREEIHITHAVSVKDGTLCINHTDSRKWYEHIGITGSSAAITVYLPQGSYTALCLKEHTGSVNIGADVAFDNIDIAATTGDICLDTVTADVMNLAVTTGNITVNSTTINGDVSFKVTTGDVHLTDITCRNLTSTGNTGNLTMTNVVAAGLLDIKRTTGNVSFASCDAADITVRTSTGDVTGDLLSEKTFIADTTTGDIRVPHDATGGKCRITTTTGDIHVTVGS